MTERILSILGSTSVGKSALITRFVKRIFDENEEYFPTIVQDFRYKYVYNGIEYNLTIFDTAGLEQQSEIPNRYTQSNGFILAYSIADRQSFEIVKDIYLKLVDELNGENKPIVLVGNKCDLTNQRVISTEEGKNLAQQWNASFLETSAKKGDNVEDVFLKLLELIDPQLFEKNKTSKNQNQNTNNSNNTRNNSNNINRQSSTDNNNSNNNYSNNKNQQQKCIIS